MRLMNGFMQASSAAGENATMDTADSRTFGKCRSGRRAWLLGAAGALALAGAGCGRKRNAAALPPGTTVLALGDSITAGTGAEAAQAYPARLAALTGWTVLCRKLLIW